MKFSNTKFPIPSFSFLIPHFSFPACRQARLISQLPYLLIFLLPIQLGTFFFLPQSYISGIRIDYLAPALYLTDIVAVVLILLNYKILLTFVFSRAFMFWKLGIAILVILNTLFAIEPLIAAYTWIKVAEMVALFVIFRNMKIDKNNVLKAFAAGALIQIILVTFQVTQGHAMQGVAYFLGERAFTLSTPGISKVALDGVEVLRGYGSFSHPNSLAGFYLLVYTFFLFLRNARHPELDSGSSAKKSGSPIGVGEDILRNSLLAICTLLILFSFSKIAIATLVLFTLVFVIQQKYDCIVCGFSKILIPAILALIVFSAQGDVDSMEKRVYLAQSSLQIITQYPILGTGLGNYLYAQSEFPIPYGYFFLQPVHNIFLLAVVELGALPLIVAMYHLTRNVYRTIKLQTFKLSNLRTFKIAHSHSRELATALILVLITTGMFDHYWLTLQQNMLLLPVIFGLLRHDKHVVQ